MDCPNKEAVPASRPQNNQPSDSLPSSRTMSPAETMSVADFVSAIAHENSSSQSESPPPYAVNSCAQSCRGLGNGCSFGENHEPHCRLNCSPRACKQCSEVIDADWIQRGRWLEDCVSWDEKDGEHQHSEVNLPTRRRRYFRSSMIVFAVSFAVIWVIQGLAMSWEIPNLPMLEVACTCD